MRRGRRTAAAGRKKKAVSYELIARDSDAGARLYPRLARLVEEWHEEIAQARIALAWVTSWKPDVDGRLVLGKCKKASDLDRELAAFDFVILLNKDFWQDARVTERQREALLDHELSHAAVKHDKDGEPVVDEKDRQVFRVRKHDLEEFAGVVERHGLYKRDLERFAASIDRGKQRSLKFEDEPPPAGPRPVEPRTH